MKNSTRKQLDTASGGGDSRMIKVKNGIRTIVTSALLLAATNATAGIIFVPMGSQYTNPELVPVNVQQLDGGSIRIHTTGLTGELSFQGSDLPPEYALPGADNGVLPFEQELELVVDLAAGTVAGRAISNFGDASSPLLVATAEVRGNISCLPRNGVECGQLVVDLELRGVLSSPNDPSVVGRIQTELLGSMIFDSALDGPPVSIFDFPTFAYWIAMPTNTTIAGNPGLISSALEYASCRGAMVVC